MEENDTTDTSSSPPKDSGPREGDARMHATGSMAILQEAVLALSVEITKLEKDILVVRQQAVQHRTTRKYKMMISSLLMVTFFLSILLVWMCVKACPQVFKSHLYRVDDDIDYEEL